jgi:hypothetical protein
MEKTFSVTLAFPAVDPVSRHMSQRIAVARVLCIVLMTFVHVQPGIAGNVYAQPIDGFALVYYTLTRLVGLSSVSLLGIVSGYLMAGSLAKMQLAAVSGKVRSLLVPLVAWNAVMFGLILVYGVLSGHWDKLPDATAIGIANAFLAVSEWPLVVPLWFLRDLFVCCVLSPLVIVALDRAPIATFALLLGYVLFGEGTWLLQRPQLLLFFAIGLWLRTSLHQDNKLDQIALPMAAGVFPVAAIFIYFRVEGVLLGDLDPRFLAALDTVLRLTMAAAVWQLTRLIAGSPILSRIGRYEPYVFLLFCSHAILFDFGGIVLRRFFGNYGDPLFAFSFFLQPALAMVVAWLGALVLLQLPPAIGEALNGGKLPRAKPPGSRTPR